MAMGSTAQRVTRALYFAPTMLLSCAGLIAASPEPQKFTPLDLSSFATRSWPEFRPWINWNGPVGGLQQLDGVPFQIDGVIQLRSVTPRSLDDALPTRAQGILVGRRVSRLFSAIRSRSCAGSADSVLARPRSSAEPAGRC